MVLFTRLFGRLDYGQEAMFCQYILPQVNFPTNNFNFYWRWLDGIQAIFSNLFYINSMHNLFFSGELCILWLITRLASLLIPVIPAHHLIVPMLVVLSTHLFSTLTLMVSEIKNSLFKNRYITESRTVRCVLTKKNVPEV